MRISLLLASILAVLITPTTARADDQDARTPPPPPPSAPLAPIADSARETPPPAEAKGPRSVPRRTVGEVLTIVGLSHIAAGGILMGVWQYDVDHHGPLDGGCGACFAPYPNFIGPAVLASGLLYTAVGVPLWVTGAWHVKQGAATSARIDLSPGRATFSLSF